MISPICQRLSEGEGTCSVCGQPLTPHSPAGKLKSIAFALAGLVARVITTFLAYARTLFSEMISFNQEYPQAVHAVPSPAAQLYTPASYGKRSILRDTISEFEALLEINKKYESVQPVLARLEANVAAAHASSAEK